MRMSISFFLHQQFLIIIFLLLTCCLRPCRGGLGEIEEPEVFVALGGSAGLASLTVPVFDPFVAEQSGTPGRFDLDMSVSWRTDLVPSLHLEAWLRNPAAGFCRESRSLVIAGGADFDQFPSPRAMVFNFGLSSDNNSSASDGDWEEIASMQMARKYTGGVCLPDGVSFLVVGGYSAVSLDSLTGCELLNTSSKVWSSFPSLINGRQGHSVVLFRDQVVTLGGCYSDNTVEAFNFSSYSWRIFPSLNTPRRFFGAAVILNKIFVAGGRIDSVGNLTASLEVYDGSAWSTLDSDLPFGPSSGFFGFNLQNRLALVGGNMTKSLIYDPSDHSWSEFAEILSNRSFLAGALVPRSLIDKGSTTTLSTTMAPASSSATKILREGILILAGNAGRFSAVPEVLDPFTTPLNYSVPLMSSLPGIRFNYPAGDYCPSSNSIVLVGGTDLSDQLLETTSQYYADLDTWVAVSPPPLGIKTSAGICLPDGFNFLLIGGENDTNSLPSVFLFNSVTNHWSQRAFLLTPRHGHKVVLYEDSPVAMGGCCSINFAEVYNIETDLWSSFPSLLRSRQRFFAAVLQGKIYAAGGNPNDPLSSVEVFSNGSWNLLNTEIPHGRRSNGAAAVFGGKFVLMGGDVPYVDAYDPATKAWSTFPSLVTDPLRNRFIAVSVPLNSFLAFEDNSVNSSSSSGDLAIVILGGSTTLYSEVLFHGNDNSWNMSVFAMLPEMRDYYPAGGYCSKTNTIVLAGGIIKFATNTTSYLKSALVYNFSQGSWVNIAPMSKPRYWTSGLCLEDQESFLVAGGSLNNDLLLDSCEFLDTTSMLWQTFPSMLKPRRAHVVLLYRKMPLVLGGWNGTSSLNTAEWFSSVSSSSYSLGLWGTFPSMNVARDSFASAVVLNKIYVAGGSAFGPLDSVEFYDGISWTSISNLPSGARMWCAAVNYHNMFVVIGGSKPVVDVYDPLSRSWSTLISPYIVYRFRFAAFTVEKLSTLVKVSPSITIAPTTEISTQSATISMVSNTPAHSSPPALPTVLGVALGAVACASLVIVVVFCFIQRKRSRHRIYNSAELKRLEALKRRSQLLLEQGVFKHAAFDPEFQKDGKLREELQVLEFKLNEIQIDQEIGCGAHAIVFLGSLSLPPAKRRLVEKLQQHITTASKNLDRSQKNPQMKYPPLQCAIKRPQVNCSLEDEIKFYCECRLLALLRHPNIVTFFGICADSQPMMMIMEHLPKGNLRNLLRASSSSPLEPTNSGPLFPLSRLVGFLAQICSAMQFLELHNIVHRDLATRNVLVGKNDSVKLADFGLSKWINNSDYYRQLSEDQVPFKWMPLEAIEDKIFTTKSDVWAFGVLCWEVMSMGETPYKGLTVLETVQFIRSGRRMDRPLNCPSDLFELMLKCWNAVPQQRPSFSRIGSTLSSISLDDSTPNPLPPSTSRISQSSSFFLDHESPLQNKAPSPFIVLNRIPPLERNTFDELYDGDEEEYAL